MADLELQMLLGRMAYRLSLLCLTTWTTLTSAATVQTNNITPEILNFVPTCAQDCFESFISDNFDARICGNSPSLQCLCRQEGRSGYTIGEGAVSCLVGESKFGSCQGQDGIDDEDARATAYNMCIGVSSAAPKTNTAIVATLLVPSETGPLVVPTAIRTTTHTGTSASTATITPTSTVSLPTGIESSTTSGLPPTVTYPVPIPTPTASRDSSGGQKQLGSAEIAGIVLGVAAVVVFGILLVMLARCIRKRRFGDVEGGFSKMSDATSYGRKSRPSSPYGGLNISSPLPRLQAQRDPLDPRWHPQMPKGANGLPMPPRTARGGVFVRPPPALAAALSAPLPPTPPRDPVPAPAPTQARTLAPRNVPKVVLSPAPESRAPAVEQSPPKPTLTLAIPQGQERIVRMPATARDSVVTEFAEDGEGDISAGAAIWRPPATDPQSATTVYFADKGGNWILRNASNRKSRAETSRRVSGPVPTRPIIHEAPAAPVEVELPSPDHKTRAERARDAYGGFSPDAVVSPLRLPRKQAQARLGSPIAFKDQRREPQFSSPSLSARLSQTAETLGKDAMPSKNQSPDPYFMMMREARDLTGGKSKQRSTRRASRTISQGSVTSIESTAEYEDDVIEDEPQVDLSPVVESPQTPISPGKSPVKYPEIPKRNDRQQMTMPSKAPEPDLLPPAHRYNVWHPPGHSSPTGAGTVPKPRTVTPSGPQSNTPRRPWNAPNLKPAPNRNPGQTRTGSPETRLGAASTAENQYWQRQRQVANPASYWNQQPQKQQEQEQQQQQAPRVRPPPPTPPYELPSEGNTPSSRRYETPPPQLQQQHQHPRRNMLPTPAATPQPQAQQSQKAQLAQQSQQSQQQQPTAIPPAGDTSSQGSLLAKRRGADKAAALMLANNSGKAKRSGNGGGNGDGNGNGKRGRGKAGWTREEQPESPYGPVPITPGWVPELTPTRKGEVLYLNVR